MSSACAYSYWRAAARVKISHGRCSSLRQKRWPVNFTHDDYFPTRCLAKRPPPPSSSSSLSHVTCLSQLRADDVAGRQSRQIEINRKVNTVQTAVSPLRGDIWSRKRSGARRNIPTVCLFVCCCCFSSSKNSREEFNTQRPRTRTEAWRFLKNSILQLLLVNRYFEPSQPQRITPRLKTMVSLSPIYHPC